MTYGDDFKNFFIIQKLEEDNKNKTLLEVLFKNKFKILIFILSIIFIIYFYNIFFGKVNMENKTLFQINSGESVNYISQNLEDKNIIDSAFTFKVLMKLFSKKSIAQAGIYEFSKEDNILYVVNKIKNAEYAIPPVKVTIPEGSTNEEIVDIISKSFLNASTSLSQEVEDFSYKNILLKINNEQQGFLFPETYLFLPNVSLDNIFITLKNKFYDRLKILFYSLSSIKKDKNFDLNNIKIYSVDMKEIDLSSYFDDTNKNINQNKKITIINDQGTTTVSIKDIITMASYLEGEANNEEDMRMVSGILWSRIKIGYYLQIDVATTTYKFKGLTKSPINNPGLVAIKAAINPIQSGYLYYLTGKDGKMYYAKDYDTHLVNIKKYLR